MLALESVVSRHGTALVLDASCARVQAGLVAAGRPPAWIATDDEAGVGLFRAASALLADAGMAPHSVGAYVFCDGPGSQLGIRTAAMAIRTWQALRPEPAPIFNYRSLRLAACGLAVAGVARPFAVVCDARRESWHAVRVDDDGAAGDVVRLSNAEVAALGIALYQPEGFRAWAAPPAPLVACEYNLGALFAQLAGIPLLEAAADAEPWNPAPAEYKKWTGERHRAPSPSADAR